jgi:hypothetical protein
MLRVTMLVVALLAVGCKKRDHAKEEAKKVTTSSTEDATQDLVDEDYRFRLRWPGKGWKVLREADARHLSADAIGGLSSGNTNAIVIVEQVPGAELERFADVVIDNMPLENKQIDRAPTKVSGIDALRVQIEGSLNDLRVRFRGVILLHQDHAYQVLAFSPVGLGNDAELDRAVAAFSIEPGDVKGRAVTTVVGDQVGIGWRIEGGVFESGASRLRVKPAEGWGLVVAGELHKMHADAEVGLAGTTLGAYCVVISEPVSGADPKAYVAGRLDEALSTLTRVDGPVRAKLIGHDVELVRARLEGGMPFEYLIGVLVDGTRGYQFIGWYPASQADRGESLVLAAFAGMELMSADETQQVARVIAGQPDHQNSVGATYALRGGTFHDFANRVRWRKPAGFWKISAGQDARALNADAQLGAVNVVTGVQTQLVIEPAAHWNNESYLEAVENQLTSAGFVAKRRAAAKVSGKPARMVEGRIEGIGLPLRYRATAAVIGGLAIQVQIWAAEGAWPDDATVESIASSLEVAPTMQAIEDSRSFRDHRLGFELALSRAWRRKDMTPEPMRAVASMHQWSSRNDLVLVIAFYTFEQRDDAWMLDLIEQLLRENVAKHGIGKPTTGTGTLAGREARQLTWRARDGRIDALLIKRDATFYAIVSVDARNTSTTIDLASTSFSLLD